MTFDVQSELPKRARELREAQQDALREAMERRDAGAGDRDHPSDHYGEPPSDYVVSEEEILTIYDDFLDIPGPEDFASVTDTLFEAMKMLSTSGEKNGTDNRKDPNGVHFANTHLAAVDTSGSALTEWRGDAAEEYRTNYGNDRFVLTASNQYRLYWALRHAVNAEAAVWQTVRADLDKLSKDAIDKMRHLNDSTQDDWKAVLSVAGAVVAVGGAVATPAGWTFAAAGVTVLSSHMALIEDDDEKKEKEKKIDLPSGTPREIIDGLDRALAEIKSTITKAEDDINDAVSSALDKVDDETGFDQFCVPRPKLAEVPRGDLYDRENVGRPS